MNNAENMFCHSCGAHLHESCISSVKSAIRNEMVRSPSDRAFEFAAAFVLSAVFVCALVLGAAAAKMAM